MRTFARLVMKRSKDHKQAVLAIGIAVRDAFSPTADAEGIPAVARGPFRNVPFTAQSCQPTAEFHATPTDIADVGFSDDSTVATSLTSIFVRSHPNGKTDGSNGAEDIDVTNHTYSIVAKLPWEAPFTIAETNLAFRRMADTVGSQDEPVVSPTWRTRFARRGLARTSYIS